MVGEDDNESEYAGIEKLQGRVAERMGKEEGEGTDIHIQVFHNLSLIYCHNQKNSPLVLAVRK